MMSQSWDAKTSTDVENELTMEKNSLRRFLAGLTATTFGVLVALHPHEFSTQLCGWLYAASVVLNATSVVFFIFSLFGRYRGLLYDGDNKCAETVATLTGENYMPAKAKGAKRFKVYSFIGIACYLVAIASSCVFLVLEVYWA